MQKRYRNLAQTPVPRSFFIVAAVLLGFSTTSLPGDVTLTTAPTTQPTTTPALLTVNDLIKQLGSDSADDRDLAQKQLIDGGQSAIPALKKAADDNPDPEIRSRAAAALAQMKDLDANGVSLITLHMKNALAGDVLSAVGTQSHAQFLAFPGVVMPGQLNPTVSLDADRKPFWEVMADLCTQLNVCPMFDTRQGNSIQLTPTPRNWMAQSPHQIVGPYWINVAGIYRTRSIDLLGPPRVDDQFSIRVMVLPEPKLAVTHMSGFVIKEARDDAGNSLLPQVQAAAVNQLLRNARQMNRTVESRLTYPANPGKTITLLRGQVTVMLAQDLQQFVVDDVLGKPKRTDPITGCKIDATVGRQGSEMFRVNLQCTRAGATDDQWTAMMNHLNDLNLDDADGHPLTNIQSSMQPTSGAGGEAGFTATALFSKSFIGGLPLVRQVARTGDAKKLTWNVATSVKPVVIPVAFKDLPMP